MRIVIKIGTSTITHPTGRLNIRQMEALCKVLSDLKNAGNEVILVSSGAIGMGVGKLRLGKKPTRRARQNRLPPLSASANSCILTTSCSLNTATPSRRFC